MTARESNDRIVVGIDFGTTYSGVAFAYGPDAGSLEKIEIIKTWPGSNKVTSDKVPTHLDYDLSTGSIKWGYELKTEQARLRCIKLLLDRGQKFPNWVDYQALTRQLATCGKTAIDVTADFVRKLLDVTKERLVQRYGQHMVSKTKIEYIFTVPAVWSEAAKDATMSAAQKAGITSNLRLISEPEAAAVYSLTSMRDNKLSVGDVYVVCDAGGGTVDLVTYEVEKLQPLSFHEIVPGSGYLCGSGFLNLRFEDLVKSRIGVENFQNINKTKPRAWPIALDSFEHQIKRNFAPSTDKALYDASSFSVPFPGLADNVAAGVEDGFITVSTAEVTETFRPVIDDVIELVERQRFEAVKAGKTVKGIILVGGFGQSSYLESCLKKRFADVDFPAAYCEALPTYAAATGQRAARTAHKGVPKLVILQPQNAWTAVVRGAVLRGMEKRDMVSSRQSRVNYGMTCSKLFDPRRHSAEKKEWEELEEKWRVPNQMKWFVRRNDTIRSGQKIPLDFLSLEDHIPTTLYTDLHTCPTDDAPSEVTKDVRLLCKFEAKLSGVPRRLWRKCRNSKGCVYYCLDYVIALEIESGGLSFTLEVDGKVCGSVKAEFM